jgi:hypothetical protein
VLVNEIDVTQIEFPRLQPLLETVWVLQQKVLTNEGILQIIFSYGVQPLRQREVVVGALLGPSCFFCPSFSQPDAVGAGPRVQEAPASGDAVGQEARHTCCKRL